MKAQTGGARSALILAALFVAVRLIVLALGQRFDADNLTSWMQIADLALLREHLWRTLWYLHSQPPLFNLMIGLALAMILHARGARGRGMAIALFVVQLVLNLAWTPLFFGAHHIWGALADLIALLLVAIVTTLLFGRIRTMAAWLMLPYLLWIAFAGVLTLRIGELNPGAETLVPGAHTSQVIG